MPVSCTFTITVLPGELRFAQSKVPIKILQDTVERLRIAGWSEPADVLEAQIEQFKSINEAVARGGAAVGLLL